MNPESYALERTRPRAAVVSGILRLASTSDYERLLAPVRVDMLSSKEPYTLDFSAVVFMNSSGIRALGDLVLAAKRAGTPLTIRSDSKSPWQKKTLASLRLLNAGLELELAGP